MLNAANAIDAVENLNSSYGYHIDESAWDNVADRIATKAGAKEITEPACTSAVIAFERC